MAKALIQVGYKTYVMDADAALHVAKALADAEEFERIYVPGEKSETGKSQYAYYVWERDTTEDTIRLELLSDNLYKMAKLAGKPGYKS